MFDDDPIEIGKERNRFLTEESGRRVYFPFVGLARVVPSGNAEAKLRRAERFVFVAAMTLFGVTTVVRPFMPEQSFPFFEGCIMLLALGANQLITSRLIRHWTAIPSTDLSYARYVTARCAKRSLIGLCFAILARGILFIGLMTALVWLATHSPPGWDDWTWFKKASWAVLFLLVIAVAASYAATSGYRAVAALRNKRWGR